jgi:plastocyanin
MGWQEARNEHEEVVAMSATGDSGTLARPPEHHCVAGLMALLAGVALFAAVIFGLTAGVGAIWRAVAGGGGSSLAATPSMPGMAPASGGAAGRGAGSPSVQRISLVVDPPPLWGVRGPDGQVHDAFVPASFTMRVGTTVVVTVRNYDAMPHTWTAPGLGVNAMVPAGSESHPSVVTFTIHPKRAGTYAWYCETPCDPWAMAHWGYMRGHVTVVA